MHKCESLFGRNVQNGAGLRRSSRIHVGGKQVILFPVKCIIISNIIMQIINTFFLRCPARTAGGSFHPSWTEETIFTKSQQISHQNIYLHLNRNMHQYSSTKTYLDTQATLMSLHLYRRLWEWFKCLCSFSICLTYTSIQKFRGQ